MNGGTSRRAWSCLLVFLVLHLSGNPAWANVPVEPIVVEAVFPHDTSAFTEGLLFRDGGFYESTGYEGQSVIRRTDLKTGRVLKEVALPPGLFGEGIVDWDDQLLSVTWRNGIGFRWSYPGLKRIGTLHYAGEGWAMTRNDRHIFLSDGTSIIRILDPARFVAVGQLHVTADGVPVRRLNELEYVRGEILANVWMTSLIARIDPDSGRVKGWLDLSALTRKIHLSDPDSVLNGIAYDAAGGRLFVTGKNWPSVFQIRLPTP